MPAPQNFKNHTRFYPPFHFFVLPALLLNIIFSIYATIHHWPGHAHLYIWWIVMAVVLLIMAGTLRTAALKVQDRVIRLEERIRLAQILPAEEHSRILQLTTRQLVALRFASDQELADLARRALDQNLNAKTIKQSIAHWRPDYERA